MSQNESGQAMTHAIATSQTMSPGNKSHTAVQQIHSYFNNKLKITLKPAADDEVLVSRERAADFKKWMGKCESNLRSVYPFQTSPSKC